jgi:hypothetical protein
MQCLASPFVRFIEVDVHIGLYRLFKQTGDQPRKVSCRFLRTTRLGIRYFRSVNRGCGESVSYTTALRAGRTEEARKYLEINCEVKRQIYVRSRQMSAKPNSKLFGAILIELRVCCVQG